MANRHPRWLLLLTLTAAALAAGEAKPSLLAQVKALHNEVVALEQAWYRALDQVPGKEQEGGPLVLRFVLRSAVLMQDLEVELWRWGGAWLQGRGWMPSINDAVHPLDAANLTITSDGGKTKLRGALALRLLRGAGWNRHILAETSFGTLEELPATTEVTVRVNEGKVTGEYSLNPRPLSEPGAVNPLPAVRGLIEGTAHRLDASLTPWHRDLPVLWRADTAAQFYADACLLEDLAGWCYRGVRAAAIARLARLEYPQAMQQTVQQSVRRPPLAAPPKTAQDSAAAAIGLGDDDEDGAPSVTAREPSDRKANEAKAAAGITAVAKRIRAITALLSQYERSGPVLAKSGSGQDPGDPDFGPWFGNEFLSDSPDKPNALPADAGSDGPQKWPSIARWQLLGPFPITRHDIAVQGLPDLAPCDDAPFILELDRLSLRPKYPCPELMGWIDWPPDRLFGHVTPLRCGQSSFTGNWGRDNSIQAWARIPVMASASPRTRDWATGMVHATYYARAEIHAPAAVELWAGFSVVERGQLWLNGVPLWFGPAQPLPWSMDNPTLLRLPFQAGRNTLVLRFDSEASSHSAWLRICVRGRPRSAATVRASQEAVAAQRASMPLTAQQGRGWLGDGSGFFPGTHPPVAWDLKRKINLLWHTPLPYWSNASPAMAQDRLFVAMEPCTLVCLSKEDGRVLWERQVSPIDLMDEPARTRGHELYRAWWTARQEVDDLPGSWKSPGGWIGRSWPWFWKEDRTPPVDERAGASKDMLALLDKRDALTKAEDPTAVQEQLTAVCDEIEALRKKESASSPEAQAAAAKVKRVSTTWGALLTHINSRPRPDDKSRMSGQDGYWQDYDGYAFATPVTDGKHVWWKNGSGAAACFDLEGNRRWLVSTKGAGHGCANISSPTLVDGKLILYLPNRGGNWTRPVLVAFDAATGRELWESAPVKGAGWQASTPPVLALTNGRERMSVIVTPGGSLVRADDGKILLTEFGVVFCDGAIVPWQDRVHFAYESKQIGRLIMVDRDQVGCQRLWCVDIPRDRVNYMGTFPAGGLVCRVSNNALDISGVCATFFDPQTGRVVENFRLTGPGTTGGNVWSFHGVSADHVYAIYGDHLFSCANGPPMYCSVFQPRVGGTVVARNVIDRTYGSPIIDGDRIYLRGYFGVYCIGYTGEDGRAYEARTVADTLLDEINHGVPSATSAAPLAVRPAASGSLAPPPAGPGHESSGNPLVNGMAVFSTWGGTVWAFAGPFALGSGDKVAASLGLPGRGAGAKGSDGVSEREFVPLTRANVTAKDLWRWDFNDDLTSRLRDRRVLELGRILGDKAPCLVYVATTVSVDRPSVWRLELSPLQARAWLNGQPVADQDRVSLEPGSYQLVLEVTIAKAGDPVPLSPRFWNSEDPVAERKAWLDYIRRHRELLQRAIDLAPDSTEAQRARAALAQAADDGGR